MPIKKILLAAAMVTPTSASGSSGPSLILKDRGPCRRAKVRMAISTGEAHLRRILRTYARYYNDIRTHWSLAKDAPVSRPVQRIGIISSHAILGGLHHHYVRV
jgi:hypothetical protein